MIDCPLCNAEMRICHERGIEIDICDSCSGVWLDAGELTHLAEKEESRRCTWTIPTSQQWPETTLHCVRCSDTLLVEVLIEDHTFKGCRICNGLFIDSGTMDSIISNDEDDEPRTAKDYIAIELLNALGTLLFS